MKKNVSLIAAVALTFFTIKAFPQTNNLPLGDSSTSTNAPATNSATIPKKKIYLKVDPHPANEVHHTRHPESFYSRAEHSLESFLGIGKVEHIFNGKSLENFYPWLRDSGVYIDRDQVFSVENGMLHITGQHQGYIATKTEFGDYKLVVEYKWGKQTWYKSKETPRNSGVFVNATGVDGIDIRSQEIQMVPGNTGGIVLHGGAAFAVGQEKKQKPWTEFSNPEVSNFEKTDDWNQLEILCEGNRIRVMLNGHIAIDGSSANPDRGKILLQSNGAEIWFRRVDLYHLDQTNSAPGVAATNAEPSLLEKIKVIPPSLSSHEK